MPVALAVNPQLVLAPQRRLAEPGAMVSLLASEAEAEPEQILRGTAQTVPTTAEGPECHQVVTVATAVRLAGTVQMGHKPAVVAGLAELAAVRAETAVSG